MRMFTYFGVAMAVVAPALLITAGLGIFGRLDLHLNAGLVSAILTVGLHTLVILFMVVTGRILREAIRSRELSQEFLDELNSFFATGRGYPAAVFGSVTIVAAAVLGYGAEGLGLSPAVHMLAGLIALLTNLWAISVEYQVLRANQGLIDRAADKLDEIDRELAERGQLPEEEPQDPRAVVRTVGVIAIAAWLPYLYWGLVVWRGDFTRVSLHPWVEISALAAVAWFLARRGLEPAAPANGALHESRSGH